MPWSLFKRKLPVTRLFPRAGPVWMTTESEPFRPGDAIMAVPPAPSTEPSPAASVDEASGQNFHFHTSVAFSCATWLLLPTSTAPRRTHKQQRGDFYSAREASSHGTATDEARSQIVSSFLWGRRRLCYSMFKDSPRPSAVLPLRRAGNRRLGYAEANPNPRSEGRRLGPYAGIRVSRSSHRGCWRGGMSRPCGRNGGRERASEQERERWGGDPRGDRQQLWKAAARTWCLESPWRKRHEMRVRGERTGAGGGGLTECADLSGPATASTLQPAAKCESCHQ